MNYPTDYNEFWEYLETHFDDIVDFALKTGYDTNIRGNLRRLLVKENKNILNTLNKIWFKAPDQGWIRELPGFFPLCNLCSEGSYCLYGEEEE